MGRKKIEKINFTDAIEAFEQEKNISKEYIAECLEGAVKKAYIKTFLNMGDDAIVRVTILPDGTFKIFEGKNVVEEVQDDYLEIGIDDDVVKLNDLKVGDLYESEVDYDIIANSENFAKFIKSVMTSFHTKINDAEKAALLELFKDKIGELITGTIDQANRITNDYMINIGKTTVPLTNKDIIGNERFQVGDEVSVYVVDVADTPKGPQIHVSRSDKGFLRRLFELNIHEIYDGTVLISDIAREAGERSKIAVYSNDPNVDACGACIGMNGQRIQVITQQLGNKIKDKEKIDVVLYSKNIPLFVKEALVPAQVIGVAMDPEGKTCTAIVKNGDLSLAIGKGGINVRLAGKLVGIRIDIKEQDAALKEHISYKTIEEIKNAENGAKLVVEDDNIMPLTAEEEALLDETDDIEMSITENAIKEEENATDTTTPEEVIVEEVKAPVVEEKIAVEVKTSYEDLLKALEAEKKEQAVEPFKKYERKPYKKPEEKRVEEVKDENKKPVQGMAIYTEEELAALEKEEVVSSDETPDYSDYDDDQFYDEH
ncbi:MAG: transcription termination factor NusA [Bacilli bacterium]